MILILCSICNKPLKIVKSVAVACACDVDAERRLRQERLNFRETRKALNNELQSRKSKRVNKFSKKDDG